LIIAVVSDFHFGYNADAFPQAREAMVDARSRADVILAPGDLFDVRVPRQETLHEAAIAFQDAKGAGSGTRQRILESDDVSFERTDNPVIAIYGTHERRAKGLSNVIEFFHTAGLLVNAHARKIFVEKRVGADIERVCVQAMGGVPEEMAAQALKLMDFKPVEGAFNVFMFHQSVRELIPQDESAMAMADLPDGFDLYINGHIHWRQELRQGGKHLIIPGSTVVTQMKLPEANPKGYYLFDTARKSLQFVEITSRPFFFRELQFKDASAQQVLSQAEAVLAEIAGKNNSQPPQVKLKLTGTLAKGLSSQAVDTTALEAKYADKLKLALDKELGSLELKEKIEFLRRMRTEKKSAGEVAAEILKHKLKEKEITSEEMPKAAVEELFELLSEGEVDAALERVLKA
jgi:DNA repair exonuclease SbcCD nuclease subunit